MNSDEVVKSVYYRLTAGNNVKLEIDDLAIKDFVAEGFRKVRQWYHEPPVAQTVDYHVQYPNTTLASQYILISTLSKKPREIEKLYDSVPQSFAVDVETNLLGLGGRVVPGVRNIVEWAVYEQYAKQMNTFLGTDLDFIMSADGTKILVSGYIKGDKVTVKYIPDPQAIEDVSLSKALDWVVDWTEARTKVAVGRVRSKFKGGDLQFEMDGDSLVSEGNEKMKELDEELKRLDYGITA